MFLVKGVLKICRSSHRGCSVLKGVFKNFAKFTGKHMCQSLFFNKVVGFRPGTFLKKRLWHKCFLVNFERILRTPFLHNTSGWLLLNMQQIYRTTPTPKCDFNKVTSLTILKSHFSIGLLLCKFAAYFWNTFY